MVVPTGSGDRPPLAAALESAWARSDRIFGIVDELLDARPIPLRHPFLFYLGHLPAFAWNQVSAVLRLPPMDPRLDRLFARGIDPDDATSATAAAPTRWPPVHRIEAYRDRVREGVRARLGELVRLEAPPGCWTVPMILEHELMHHETLLYMVARLDPDRLDRPATWHPPVAGPAPAHRRVRVEGGPVTLGRDRDATFGWCNEFPARVVQVPRFDIDDLPVTLQRFLPFVASGGYTDPRWWSEEDWRWRQAMGVEHPDAWRRGGDGWQVRSLFGWHPLEEVGGWPVYVSLAEARAWCRWAGARLPTEPELHRAAFTTPEGAERPFPWGEEPCSGAAGFDFTTYGPTPVGRHPHTSSAWGVHELVGNGWEWTDTPFLRWPGFVPHLQTYPGYSADFFDGRHFVVFGGSWCTDRRLIRRTFRNWYQARYPYAFITFRTVAL